MEETMSDDLIKKEKYLPATLDELKNFILIGQEKLKAYQAKLRAVNKLNLAKGIKEKALEDTQIMGEALLYAEAKFGELIKPLSNPTASREGRRQLPEGITHKQSHYAQQLADHKEEIQQEIAEAIEHQDIPTKRGVLKRIQKAKVKPIAINPPSGEYRTIVIDPPWSYGTEYDDKTRRVASPYPEISLEKLKEIKLPAYKDCILWLWTTNGFMKEAYALLDHWQFEPKTILTWNKMQLGVGYWLRGVTEHCILATQGKPNWINKKYTTLIEEQRTKHSKKPDIFYKIVKELCDKPRIDMFGRERKEDFDSWGNEI